MFGTFLTTKAVVAARLAPGLTPICLLGPGVGRLRPDFPRLPEALDLSHWPNDINRRRQSCPIAGTAAIVPTIPATKRSTPPADAGRLLSAGHGASVPPSPATNDGSVSEPFGFLALRQMDLFQGDFSRLKDGDMFEVKQRAQISA